jgi:hypothetical protein
MSLPIDSKQRKQIPIYSGVLKYFPDALAKVAEVSYVGNQQHNPDMPLHWDRSKSTDQLDACARHLVDVACFEDPTGDEALYTLAQVAWRALAELQLRTEDRVAEDAHDSNLIDEANAGRTPWYDLQDFITKVIRYRDVEVVQLDNGKWYLPEIDTPDRQWGYASADDAMCAVDAIIEGVEQAEAGNLSDHHYVVTQHRGREVGCHFCAEDTAED